MSKTVDQLVDAAKSGIRSATPTEVADRLRSGEMTVVDVREPDEYEAGHIPGAINIPRGWLEFKADPTCAYYDERIGPDKPLLVHCAAGKRSALATATLGELGYRDATNLEGGFEAWDKEGYAVERPEAVPAD